MSDGRGDAKGTKLSERLRAPDLRGRPRQARTGELVSQMVYLMIILSSITILYITAFTVHLKSKMLCASLGKTLPIFIRAGLFVLCVNHHKC